MLTVLPKGSDTHSHCKQKKAPTASRKAPKRNCKKRSCLVSRQILYTHPPPLPHFWPKGIFQGRGVGVYISWPYAAGILYAPPPLYTPPTPRRVFSGVGVYKNRPRMTCKQAASNCRFGLEPPNMTQCQVRGEQFDKEEVRDWETDIVHLLRCLFSSAPALCKNAVPPPFF